MYCEVTREQAVELLTIEGQVRPEHYINLEEYGVFGIKYIWIDSITGLILSGITHGEMKNELPFPDFKQRLVNTINNK